jgi:hypothetical protein
VKEEEEKEGGGNVISSSGKGKLETKPNIYTYKSNNLQTLW